MNEQSKKKYPVYLITNYIKFYTCSIFELPKDFVKKIHIFHYQE